MSTPTPASPPTPPAKMGRGRLFGLIGAVVAGALLVTVLTSKDKPKVTTAVTTLVPAAAGAAAAGQNQAVVVSGAVLAKFDDNATDPAVGVTAPTLEGRDFLGQSVKVAPGDGKPKMIVFVAHWCPHCQREVPRLVGWIADGSIPKSVEMVAVSTGVQTDAPNYPPSAWLTKVAWPSTVLADSTKSDAGAAYGLSGYPYFVMVDGAGKVVARASGEKELADLKPLLAKLGV